MYCHVVVLLEQFLLVRSVFDDVTFESWTIVVLTLRFIYFLYCRVSDVFPCADITVDYFVFGVIKAYWSTCLLGDLGFILPPRDG